MGKRVVIALGGNALGNNLPEQMIAVKQTARAIVDLIEEGLLDKDFHTAVADYTAAVLHGVVKIASKMGISTLQSYQSAQIFEAVGIRQDVIDKYFTNTVSRVGGIGLEEMAAAVERNHDRAFDPLGQETDLTLESLGEHKARAGGEDHLYNPQTIHLLQQAGEELTDGLGLLVIHFFAQCLHGSGLPGLLLRGGRRRLRRLALLSGRLFRFGGLRPLFLRLLLGGRRGGENLLFLLRAVAHPDLGRAAAQTQKTGLCSLQNLNGHIVPVQAKLPQGILDGLILGLARYINKLSHGVTSSLLIIIAVLLVGPAAGIGPVSHTARFRGAGGRLFGLQGLGLLRRLPLFLQALLLCGLLTLLLLPLWKLQKVVSTKNSKLSLLKVLHLS